MKQALCESGLLKTLFDNLGGKNTAEWHEILRRALRRENPFQDQSITFALRLTPAMIAGTKALAELHPQGRISTTNWHSLEVEPLDNHDGYSDAFRRMTFTLENGQRVEVNTMTWKRGPQPYVGDSGRKWTPVHSDTVEDNETYTWFPTHVYVEKGPRMEFFEN